jgi:hypothetical protein
MLVPVIRGIPARDLLPELRSSVPAIGCGSEPRREVVEEIDLFAAAAPSPGSCRLSGTRRAATTGPKVAIFGPHFPFGVKRGEPDGLRTTCKKRTRSSMGGRNGCVDCGSFTNDDVADWVSDLESKRCSGCSVGAGARFLASPRTKTWKHLRRPQQLRRPRSWLRF